MWIGKNELKPEAAAITIKMKDGKHIPIYVTGNAPPRRGTRVQISKIEREQNYALHVLTAHSRNVL